MQLRILSASLPTSPFLFFLTEGNSQVPRRLHRILGRVNSEMIFRLRTHLPSRCISNKAVTLHSPSRTRRVRCFQSSRPSHNHKISATEGDQSIEYLTTSSRVSRTDRIDAQDVLFDYLHCTRNFPFTDAEHISKNSPHFLQKLLSVIDDERDIRLSLSRFLRYNPINEFEPFLESLGLTPSELLSLLPRDLMFLSDDSLLVDSYHALCNYGIPRSKMGRMYKEAEQIFRYDCGVLAGKLRGYEDLGLSRSVIIKLVSCWPSLLIGDVSTGILVVLEKLKGLGMWDDFVGGYLSDQRTCHWKRMLDLMEFLDEVGYSEEQMGHQFKRNPALLFEGSMENIYVLFGRLVKLGIEMNELSTLFVQNPEILSGKFVKNLWRAVCFLSDIGMGVHDIASIVRVHIQLLGFHSLKGPKTVLSNLKIGRDDLCQILKEDPLKLFSLASKSKSNKGIGVDVYQNPSKHQEKATFLLRLGYAENSDDMSKALKQFRGRGDQLQERFDCLVRAGLESDVVTNMIKQAPSVLNQTKDVLEKKIDYLRSYLGYPLDSVVERPKGTPTLIQPFPCLPIFVLRGGGVQV
ncbi:hypothetical protein Nepgr_004519 [Nepenthes gracilis]|uniref:Transcription termination factor MTEF18, mitochondrial n=1 Tax=Nepenthes gracilis TaxID=150966 RepID=A0AAD3S1I5_NEPGR|nr:hypothetical protein Nepgr_004519 [Nepenthes gracilis]